MTLMRDYWIGVSIGKKHRFWPVHRSEQLKLCRTNHKQLRISNCMCSFLKASLLSTFVTNFYVAVLMAVNDSLFSLTKFHF